MVLRSVRYERLYYADQNILPLKTLHKMNCF